MWQFYKEKYSLQFNFILFLYFFDGVPNLLLKAEVTLL